MSFWSFVAQCAHLAYESGPFMFLLLCLILVILSFWSHPIFTLVLLVSCYVVGSFVLVFV